MTYTRSSPIRNTRVVTGDQLFAAFQPMVPAGQLANAKRACDAIAIYSAATGVDPLVVAAIVWIETGAAGTGLPFRSSWWVSGFNAGNLGITGDDTQNAAAQIWSTPGDGVLATVAHLVAYSSGKSWRSVWDVDALGDPAVIDKRFALAIANTPNSAGVTTLADLNRRWAIDADDDYGGKLAERANTLAAAIKDPPVTTPSTPEEPVEQETPVADPLELIRDYLVDAYVTKQREGQGFNYGTRNPVGLGEHETQGIMTGPQRKAFFSCPNGERCEDALVDFGIPRNEKKIYRFQDPFTSNRIPWASGGAASAITQLARKASAQMGNPAGGVNAFYAAVEIEKEHGQAMTADQIEMTARLLAYICAMNNYPADDWKYPDVLGNNVPTSVNHSDLYTSTNCRINDDDRAKFEARCTALLKTFYAGPTPVEPGSPSIPTIPVTEEVIPGLDYAIAARLFGSVKGEDNATYKFDKNGPVSKLWLTTGKATGNWPALTAVYSYESGARRYFRFEGGATIIAAKGQDPRWLKEAAAAA